MNTGYLNDVDRGHDGGGGSGSGIAPGKRSLTQAIAPRPIVFRAEARDAKGVQPGADAAIDRAASSSGEPLRDDLRSRFESSIGGDLSSVRVHRSEASAEASSAVGARAYTVGQDIHFAAGQYQPDDPFGMHLIAHEVAHTRQQDGAAPARQNKLEVSSAGDAAEVEADRAADAMVSARPFDGLSSHGGGVQRDPDPAATPGDAPAAAPAAANPRAGKGSPEKEAEFEARAAAASKAMDDAGHTQGPAARPEIGSGTQALGGQAHAFPQWFIDLQRKLSLTAQWGPAEEDAQHVLRDYANYYVQTYYDGKPPPSIATMFEYVGRSSTNQAAAEKEGDLSTKHYGGTKGSKNWCTATTSQGMIDGLATLGYAPASSVGATIQSMAVKKDASGAPLIVQGEAAYSAQLHPGDMVMWLADHSQYGGHTVTVVDDLGDSFTHVSGNTGEGVGVGIGEAKRLKQAPKPLGGGGDKFVLGKCNDVGDESKDKEDAKNRRAASSAYIGKYDFEGCKLVYSITRYSAMFDEIGSLPDLDEAEQAKVLAKYKLKPITKKG